MASSYLVVSSLTMSLPIPLTCPTLPVEINHNYWCSEGKTKHGWLGGSGWSASSWGASLSVIRLGSIWKHLLIESKCVAHVCVCVLWPGVLPRMLSLCKRLTCCSKKKNRGSSRVEMPKDILALTSSYSNWTSTTGLWSLLMGGRSIMNHSLCFLPSYFATCWRKTISKHKQELALKTLWTEWILYPCRQVSRQSLWWCDVSLHAQGETSGLDVLTDRQSKGQKSHLPIKNTSVCKQKEQ